jgi:hypothetical protein
VLFIYHYAGLHCICAGHVAYRILVINPEGKRSFVRSNHRGEDNIKMCLKEIRGAAVAQAV